MEMQRRLLTAIREFNVTSTRQARTMILLTWAIVGLTVALGVLALLQLKASSASAVPSARQDAAPTVASTATAVIEWQAFFYADIKAARGKPISLTDVNAAPKFKTLQSCMAWGNERGRQVAGSGFQCATGCEFNEIARDVICQDSSPILP